MLPGRINPFPRKQALASVPREKKPTFSQMRKAKYGCGEQKKVAAPVHSTTFTSKQCVKAIFCQKNNYWWWCTISQTHKNSNLHSLKGRRFQNTSLLALLGRLLQESSGRGAKISFSKLLSSCWQLINKWVMQFWTGRNSWNVTINYFSEGKRKLQITTILT